jgi:DNA-directed RNA polymerase beta subunit
MPNGVNGVLPRRIDFSKIPSVIQIPNLIEVQKRSYDRFLQMNALPSERDDFGLQAVFNSVFPSPTFVVLPNWILLTIPLATGNANAEASAGCTTCAAPVSRAATRW